MHLLFDNGYHHVNGDGDPNLGFDSILGGSVKRFDSKVLFDPFEEQLDLPATSKQFGDSQCG